jgi:hypothetical protein
MAFSLDRSDSRGVGGFAICCGDGDYAKVPIVLRQLFVFREVAAHGYREIKERPTFLNQATVFAVQLPEVALGSQDTWVRDLSLFRRLYDRWHHWEVYMQRLGLEVAVHNL